MDRKVLLREVRRGRIRFVPAKRALSVYPGEWPSTFEGKGFEPLRFRDFQMGDDPRRIHAPTSARRGSAMVGERVALRDFRIMVAVDCSASMRVREKPRILLLAAALLLYSALEAETAFGLALEREGGLTSFGVGVGSRHFHYLYRILWNLLAGEAEVPGGRPLRLDRALAANTMLFYCSDFLDARGAPADVGSLWGKTRRYDFIPVLIQDELEFDFPRLPASTFVTLRNPETGEVAEAWLTRSQADAVSGLHQARFQALKAEFGRRGCVPVHLASASPRQAERRFNTMFRLRRGR